MLKTSAAEKNKPPVHSEGKGLIFLSVALITLCSLLSFHIDDPSKNWLGLLGWGLSFALKWTFGFTSYLLVVFLGWIGWQYLLGKSISSFRLKTVYFSLLLVSISLLFNLMAEQGIFLTEALCNRIYTESVFLDLPYPHRMIRYNLGGVPLYYLYRDLPTMNLQRMLSDVGIGLTFSITGIVSFFLLTQLKIIPIFSRWKIGIHALLQRFKTHAPTQDATTIPFQDIEHTLTKQPLPPIYQPHKHPPSPLKIRTMNHKEISEGVTTSPPKKQAPMRTQQGITGDSAPYELPPLSLLKNGKKIDMPSLKKEIKKQAEILEETLLSFGIEAKVGEINCGPTITSFEVHPAIGVKVQKIKTLENDIALNLQAKSIRIIAPIPGKAAVGVEIPSLCPQEVSFKELLHNYHQNPRKMFIPLLLGKSVSGDDVISDLSKMPHCLIAGATGSGKSVCINTIIMSIVMNAHPNDIKLLMIDPKKVELTPYTNLPHMIAPVITEAHGAYAALNWLVKEMQLRYEILKQLGLRNITAFNNRSINPELESSLSIPIPVKMHAIVGIIDEFADLMMASSSDLETPIARIAQMARAVGIHLILATQRPSREVITGLIKANFPTRIAFKVASRINSQITLDDVGAESLLGNGDFLFLPPGSSALMRAQGAYMSDEEISQVIRFCCDQAPPHYLISSFDKMKPEEIPSGASEEEGGRDSLYEMAFNLVMETKIASTTFLQRKLKIGYARAASLMDELELKGIISAQEGSKPRRVLEEIPQKKVNPYER